MAEQQPEPTQDPTGVAASGHPDPTVPPEHSPVPVGDGPAYDAAAITVLEGLEAVRKRPGMYIGSTGERGLQRRLGEVEGEVCLLADECGHRGDSEWEGGGGS